MADHCLILKFTKSSAVCRIMICCLFCLPRWLFHWMTSVTLWFHCRLYTFTTAILHAQLCRSLQWFSGHRLLTSCAHLPATQSVLQMQQLWVAKTSCTHGMKLVSKKMKMFLETGEYESFGWGVCIIWECSVQGLCNSPRVWVSDLRMPVCIPKHLSLIEFKIAVIYLSTCDFGYQCL